MSTAFDAKLSRALILLEAGDGPNRRDFVRQAIASLGLNSNVIGVLTKLGLSSTLPAIAAWRKSGYTEEEITDDITTILSGFPADSCAPPSVIKGWLSEKAMTDPTAALQTVFGETDALDEYVGGSLNAVFDAAVAKIGGPQEAIKVVTNTCKNPDGEALFGILTMQQKSKEIKKYLGNVDIGPALDDARLSRSILSKAGYDRDAINRYVKSTYPNQQYNKEHENDWDKLYADQKAMLKPDHIEPDEDDHIRHSSMHQPYESVSISNIAKMIDG